MTCTGTLLFKCSDAKTRRQSCGKSTSGRPSARRAPAAIDTARESGANRLDAERARMFGALQQIRRAWPRLTFVMVPMIAGRHGLRAIEALHVADDFGDHAAETVADRDDARAIEFRRLDVEQVVHAAVRELAFEDIERREFAGLFDAEAALHEQLDQRPIPKRRRFGGRRASVARLKLQRHSGRLPVLQRTRSNRRHFTFEVEDRRRDPCLRPCAGFLEADAHQVAAHQRDDARRVWRKRRVRLSRPRADVREEGADFEQPHVRGRAQVGAGVFAALAFARACDRVRNIGAPMRGRTSALVVISGYCSARNRQKWPSAISL